MSVNRPSLPIWVLMTPCALPRFRKMAAPAPSPKRTQVFRSVQLVMEVNLSAPMTSTVSCACEVINCWAISKPKRKPAQAAEISRQAALVAPIFFCTKQAVAGNNISGVAVATRIISISAGEIPACAMAWSAAFAAMSLVCSSFATTRRSLIPVRVVIHSSLFSTILHRSALVRIFSGTLLPLPIIETVRWVLPERGLERGCCFMITANLLDDMRVHLLFNRLRRDPQCVFDRQRRARAVRNDANTVDTERRAAPVLLIFCFPPDLVKVI